MFQFQRYGFILVLVVSFGIPFVFYSTNLSTHQNLSLVEKILYLVTRPVESAFHGITHSVTSIYTSYVDLRNVREEAEALRQENVTLKLKLKNYPEVVKKNNEFRKLLNLTAYTSNKFVTSEIIGGDPSFIYKSIRVLKGSKDGVMPGMGLVASSGVLGVVMRVNKSVSDTLLITDPNSNLDVIVVRNRRRGILQGGLGSLMHFKYLERGSNILVGDEIVTSGLTGPFPQEIAVGRVTAIRKDDSDVTEYIEVQPAVDFSSLSEAIILLQPNREVNTIYKMAGQQWMNELVESQRSGKKYE